MIGQFLGLYECVFLEECHIQDATFKVTIPSLFVVNNGFTPNDSSTSNINKSVSAGNGNEGMYGNTFNYSTFITARNFTDYTYQYIGDIEVGLLTKVKSITEPRGGGVGASSDEPHDHDLRADIHFAIYKHVYKKLNNVKIPKGSRGYGFFINGSIDQNSFTIWRIEGAVPLNAKEAKSIFYVEKGLGE